MADRLAGEVSRDSVPSNYGGWMNLTEGYTEDKGSDHQKMQVEIEGDVIHLCWCEQQIAPLDETGEPYVHAWTLMLGGNGDSYNYHPQMAIDGNTIHVTYRATIYNSYYYYYTLYQNSKDFGQTWSEPVVLPDATGDFGTIAAKGQNVYIYTTNQGRHTIYYSNDGGTTWNSQLAATFDNNRYNPSRSFSLVIDPYDESGQHAWLTGNRYFYAETRDGFKTLSKHFVLGTESFKGQYRSNNYGLEVYPDHNGLEHWFTIRLSS